MKKDQKLEKPVGAARGRCGVREPETPSPLLMSSPRAGMRRALKNHFSEVAVGFVPLY